ncbi:hypothetical protein [Methylobacterium gnaphalii]|uniref:Uncharacterized protein n=1 Tax=Methylobacterium gnaphalii TaxID=1010610 RepID=A0A512JMA8_9HYPH|nr:hypothetical protein [Methylobacterium gnaphalii]GEP10983.1 hypothetical protein MGN01_28280 [Methylobacterium gnaphalii]GJD69761.1 hypothetical protein MMMDOFMJ_2699 [Methylobacterium gnaphalii]GLS50262.1 hypothetical protein GCM10007885_31140 [Methylobacterium gnaphalii]
MDPHRFEHDGNSYEVLFERTPEGWVARIRCEDDDTVQVMAFPNGVGFDPENARGSLIAGCQAAVARHAGAPATRH